MTPDNDGDSDQFGIIFPEGATPFEFAVLDKAGAVIFQSPTAGMQWNGKFMNTGALVQRGTYTYRLSIAEETFEGRFQVDY